jgi:hypothetical protein
MDALSLEQFTFKVGRDSDDHRLWSLDLLQGRRQSLELRLRARIEHRARRTHHGSERTRCCRRIAARGFHETHERRAHGIRQCERRHPGSRASGTLGTHGLRKISRRSHVVRQPCGQIRGEGNLALSTNGRASGERRQRGEAERRDGERVWRLRNEHRRICCATRSAHNASFPHPSLYFAHGTSGEVRPLGRR